MYAKKVGSCFKSAKLEILDLLCRSEINPMKQTNIRI